MGYEHRQAELQFKKAGEDSLYPIQFSVHEQISQPWVARITARSEKMDIPLHHLVGFSAGLRATAGTKNITWTGVVRTMELVKASKFSFEHSTYYLEIVPNLWLLSQRRGHRIFQHKTTEEIVTAILKEWDIAFEWRLRDEHATHEYRVQYGESDLGFISRLLEEEGIAYHFDQGSGQKQITKVILQEQPRRGGTRRLRYHDSVPDTHVGFWATKLHVAQASRSGNATQVDFDFRRPDTVLSAGHTSEVSSAPEKSWEQYLYSPGGFLIDNAAGAGDTPAADIKSVARHEQAAGKSKVKKMLEAMQFKRRFVDFETNMLDLSPGMHFLVDGTPTHPRADIHEQEMMIVESSAVGNATGEFVLLATAVFDDDPFVVPRVTPKPRIDGVQSAIVVGAPGQEIYCDEFGRVRVRFHWDREGKYDESCTCWLRVNQGWAGPGYGSVNLPRVGHEVLVEFLDGDPDHPVVVGRLYNATSQFPYTLPAHKTHSAWKTQSSPFKDGYYNEVFIDDQVDKELIYIQAQRNLMKLVKNNETRRVGKDRLDVVGEHRLGVVRNVDAYHVGEQHLVKMIKERKFKILEKEDPTFEPKDTWMELKDEKITLTTGKASIILDGPDITIVADKGVRFSADSDLKIKGTMVFLNCGKAAAKGVSSAQVVDDKVRKLDDGDRTNVKILELLNKELKKKVLSRGWGFVVRNHERKKPRKQGRGFVGRQLDKIFKKGDQREMLEADLGDAKAGGGEQQWSHVEILALLAQTPTGMKVLQNVPPDVSFTSREMKGSNGAYSGKTNTVYLPPGISSKDAAPIVAHELTHADQRQNHGRPADLNDHCLMEVEANNVGVNVFEEMGGAEAGVQTPGYARRSQIRKADPEKFNEATRSRYEDHYRPRYEGR